MIEANSNHCQIVTDTLNGKRRADERTFASLEILSERLERLRSISEAFSGVEFSSAALKLQENGALAVG